MHSAVRYQADQVQPAAPCSCFAERFPKHRVFVERAVVDALVDADEILQDDAPASHDHVPDFGVSHLPVRQAHRGAAGLQLGECAFGEKGVQPRGAGLHQGVVLGVGVDADPVQDDQDGGTATIHVRHYRTRPRILGFVQG